MSTRQLPSESQVLVTSYQFQCCGNVTRWQTYVRPGGGAHQGVYTISFQVWRDSKAGCYQLMGQDDYDDIPLGAGGLVDRALQPEQYIAVQPGDVLGYYMSNDNRENNDEEGIELITDGNEVLWYFTNTLEDFFLIGPPQCLVMVGINGTLPNFSNSAPVFNVEIGRYDVVK